MEDSIALMKKLCRAYKSSVLYSQNAWLPAVVAIDVKYFYIRNDTFGTYFRIETLSLIITLSKECKSLIVYIPILDKITHIYIYIAILNWFNFLFTNRHYFPMDRLVAVKKCSRVIGWPFFPNDDRRYFLATEAYTFSFFALSFLGLCTAFTEASNGREDVSEGMTLRLCLTSLP